ncbi:OmpA family protein [Silvimonas iriomotensis]|uniref:Membrane protein n=1 Tax=Silvimonas iriomotensis TaxID=449662 RepID=A0ABQ2PD10_9NEIS|nr:OmpA family protein [Silvimonas iriomotensis]GGP23099.1 membrane protein [Silvimonas iriomotensis]
MKANVMAVAILGALASAQGICADDFAGWYVGGKVGANVSDAEGISTSNGTNVDLDKATAATAGVEAGYNWQRNDWLVGVSGFYDYNDKAKHDIKNDVLGRQTKYGSQDYGLDLKLGKQIDKFLPYAKVGYGHVDGKGDLNADHNDWHAGLGVEYKLAPNWGLAGEWTTMRVKNNDNQRLKNNNFTLNLNYYFGGNAAPVVATAAAVVPALPQPKPVVVAPQPKCTDVTTSTPVRLDGANFNTNSSVLKNSDIKVLNEVVKGAQSRPDIHFEVAGFTDSRGSLALNKRLSENRALAVKQYLVSHGVDASRITTNGYGPDQAVATNATEAGRAQNRRVEIRFTKNETTQQCK